jgi:hypothetical protein
MIYARGKRREEEYQISIYTYDLIVGTRLGFPLPFTSTLTDLEAPNNHDVDLQYFHHDGRGRGRGDVSSFNEVGFNKS